MMFGGAPVADGLRHAAWEANTAHSTINQLGIMGRRNHMDGLLGSVTIAACSKRPTPGPGSTLPQAGCPNGPGHLRSLRPIFLVYHSLSCHPTRMNASIQTIATFRARPSAPSWQACCFRATSHRVPTRTIDPSSDHDGQGRCTNGDGNREPLAAIEDRGEQLSRRYGFGNLKCHILGTLDYFRSDIR